MITEAQLTDMIKESKATDKDRKFKQALELIMVFKDIDVKKGFSINETIQLPKQTSTPATVCVMASGDM
ncbi:MAG: 50S ribosomal protein L1, partial [Nitrosopumilaceae archaeon]